MIDQEKSIRQRIRIWIIIFIVGLIISGLTAFPIESQLAFAHQNISRFPLFMRDWISKVYFAVNETNSKYPYLSYGTDWLAFAHIVISIAFIGPLKDPIRNVWVIKFGMISCVLVFPLALIAGHIRQIPLYWRLIDCSFGVIGFAILYTCYRNILTLIKLRGYKNAV